tara:strand:+ start:40 stop:210 length:171 start_codon:yes stop_codon:yes gene_type:complete
VVAAVVQELDQTILVLMTALMVVLAVVDQVQIVVLLLKEDQEILPLNLTTSEMMVV